MTAMKLGIGLIKMKVPRKYFGVMVSPIVIDFVDLQSLYRQKKKT